MQTFLISTGTYSETARQLDNRRLNKQILEGWQLLLNILKLDPMGNHREPRGWSNHPARNMWVGSEMELYKYIQAMAEEWEARGFKNSVKEKSKETIKQAVQLNRRLGENKPEWMLNKELFAQICSTHRKALLVKEYEFYSQFRWDEDEGKQPYTYEYIWPV